MSNKFIAPIGFALALGIAAPSAMAQGATETAVFAGGCFWCVEEDMQKVDGVIDAVSGYTGGTLENPTYKQVTQGGTGHYEAVEVTFDPSKVSYEELTDYFLRHIDPTDAGGQFCDRGPSYRTAIFASPDQQATAQAEIAEAAAELGADVVTPVLPVSTFYPAEEYHQEYSNKNPLQYRFYKASCGRVNRIEQVWSKAS